MKKRIVAIIAPPGSGKTSLAEKAAKLLGISYLSSGDVARRICDANNDDRLDKGEMGPEEEVRMEVSRLIRDMDDDVILDGMPRHMEQLDWFRKEFVDFDLRYVYVDVPVRVCRERLISRARDMGDSADAVIKRMEYYTCNTAPILEAVWASKFNPAPYADENVTCVDFCRFLLSTRTVRRKIKIKLLPEHPLYGMTDSEIRQQAGLGDDQRVEDLILYKKYKGDAGLDLFVTENLVVKAHGKANVKTSIAIEIPPFYWYGIDKRSSTFYNLGMLVIEPVIDNGYRGELFCTVQNLTDKDVLVESGQSIAQLIFHELVGYDFETEISQELKETDRGSNGFGSTTDAKEIVKNLYQSRALVEGRNVV